MKINPWDDCSEITEDLLDAAGGKGKILTVTPGKGDLRLFENGTTKGGFKYHQVFTDGKYGIMSEFQGKSAAVQFRKNISSTFTVS